LTIKLYTNLDICPKKITLSLKKEGLVPMEEGRGEIVKVESKGKERKLN
jgi:hypothetical protein